MLINRPLRLKAPHPLPVTVTFLDRAVRKLRSVELSGPGGESLGHFDLWRGMKNVEESKEFDEQGICELALMSTTLDLHVAVDYSLSPNSLLFKIKTKNAVQRGADIRYLSAFPAEREFLYPPLTYLQPTGRPNVILETEGPDGAKSKLTVIEVEPSVS